MQQTHIPRASNNIWQNVYAGSYYGSGTNLINIPFSAITNVSIDYNRSEITNKFTPQQTIKFTNGADPNRIPGETISKSSDVTITSVPLVAQH